MIVKYSLPTEKKDINLAGMRHRQEGWTLLWSKVALSTARKMEVEEKEQAKSLAAGD